MALLSVIVPVYNVEPYLEKCLDSILAQTFKDIEVLVIDDGSTDRSGEICDGYAKTDSRIQVLHTENRGLSAARNLGLHQSHGEWIGFVDSDDWIEPDMYELLLKKAHETGADVVECGVIREYPDRIVERKSHNLALSGTEAVHALLSGTFSTGVMNKIWKHCCFENIQFPEGSVYEDIATTYQVFAAVKLICGMDVCKYHYFCRDGSITKTNSMGNLVDLWHAQKTRYESLKDRVNDYSRDVMLRLCAKAGIKMWVYYYDCPLNERKANQEVISDIHFFFKTHYPLFGNHKWKLSLRCGGFFPHFQCQISFWMARLLHKAYGKLIFGNDS